MKYTEDWPRWPPQDKIVEFMEQYAKAMGVDIRMETEVIRIQYDESARRYRVDVRGATGPQAFYPRQVVLAAGMFNLEPVVPDFPGQDLFEGQAYHSSKHRSAKLTTDLHNERIAVVGAVDFAGHGAKSVTMVQRQAIFSFSSASTEELMLSLWNTEELATEEADIIALSMPTAVVRAMNLGLTKMICAHDRDMLAGLQAAGMAVKTGEGGASIFDYQFIKGSRFYIDQGASQMIIDGRITIRQCGGGVERFDADGLTLADGTHLHADVIILATGYQRDDLPIKNIVGQDAHRRRYGGEKFGYLDQEHERIGWWRQTGMPGLWYATGSFIWSRQFSLPLALQIAALGKGLITNHYHAQKDAALRG